MTRYRNPISCLLVAAAAILSLALGGAAGASTPRARADRLPVLADGDGHFAVRPATIAYTGDGSGISGRLPGDTFHHVVGQRPGFLHWTTSVRSRPHALAGVGPRVRRPLPVIRVTPRSHLAA